MKCKQCLAFFIAIILKICFVLAIENNENFFEKDDDKLVEKIQSKVINNETDDDITDSIKELLNSDSESQDKK